MIAAAAAARADLIAPVGRKRLLPVGSRWHVACIAARDVVDKLAATPRSGPEARSGQARLEHRID